MENITPIFLQYCKEKKIFPDSIINNEDWRKNIDFFFLKIRAWYREGGQEEYLKFLEKGYNIIIEEGITPAPEINKNCPECPKEQDYIRSRGKGKARMSITKIVQEKLDNVTGKRHK